MSERFFVERLIDGPEAELLGPEAHHLAHVMRGKPGDEVMLFDGSGTEFTARVERVARSTVKLSIVNRADVDRELKQKIVLGVALPKGERQRWLVEKAVEVGVAELIPLATLRSIAEPGDAALGRLRRTVIEASKQCGRNKLMGIRSPQKWSSFLNSAPPEAARWIAHPGGKSLNQVDERETWLAIGPEGGFTDEEIKLARQSSWRLVDLGPRILRVETAAIALSVLAAGEASS